MAGHRYPLMCASPTIVQWLLLCIGYYCEFATFEIWVIDMPLLHGVHSVPCGVSSVPCAGLQELCLTTQDTAMY